VGNYDIIMDAETTFWNERNEIVDIHYEKKVKCRGDVLTKNLAFLIFFLVTCIICHGIFLRGYFCRDILVGDILSWNRRA